MRYLLLLLPAFYLLGIANVNANDTLRYYQPGATVGTYNTTNLPLQVARFDLPAPAYINGFILELGGIPGSVTVHLYGHEGGTAFPQFQNDLITPITVEKIASGRRKITVELDNPVFVNNNQFFVAVTGFTTGTTLYTDNIDHPLSCSSSNGGDYYFTFFKNASGSWTRASTNTALAIDVLLTYPQKTSPQLFKDVTSEAGIPLNLSNKSIAWADYDGDGFLDFMVAGRLFKNNGDGTFNNVTSTAGLSGSVLANAFIDMNNNGKWDLLFLRNTTSHLYLNNGDGTFSQHELSLPAFQNISSYSIADFNNDGFPDIFVGQLWGTYPDALPNYLFMNNGDSTFSDNTVKLYSPSASPRRSRGSMWVDYNNDGYPDLYVTNYFLERDELYRNNGDGTFTEVINSTGIDIHNTGSSHGTGVDWADYDNDGNMDLLLPQLAHPAFMLQHDHRPTTIYRNMGPPSFAFDDRKDKHGIQYEETHAGATWGDVNNDGLLDFFITTYYGCRYVDLYLQLPDNTFERRTFDYGIDWIVSGEDAVFVDFNNNGRLDLAAGEEGRLRLFRNEDNNQNNFVHIELESSSANKMAVGARIVVYAGGKIFTREVHSGRGQKMQSPTRQHFGLGNIDKIDRVGVTWPANPPFTEYFPNVNINQLNKLVEGTGWPVSGKLTDMQQVAFHIHPNPSSSQFNFEFSIQQNAHVQIEIYDMLGRKIAEVAQGNYDKGTHIENWDTFTQNTELTKGIYICRAVIGEDTFKRKIIFR